MYGVITANAGPAEPSAAAIGTQIVALLSVTAPCREYGGVVGWMRAIEPNDNITKCPSGSYCSAPPDGATITRSTSCASFVASASTTNAVSTAPVHAYGGGTVT